MGQAGHGRPEQRYCPSHVGSSHRRTAHCTVTGSWQRGTDSRARGDNIRFKTAAPIDVNRPPAAKTGEKTTAGHRADGVRSVIDSRRICHAATAGIAFVPGRDDGHDTGRALRLDGRPQSFPTTALCRRATPGVVGHVRRQVRISLAGITAHRVRGEKELETLQVGCRAAPASIHIATADPGSARSHADLIASTVVSDGRAHRVGPMSIIITGLGRISAADTTAAVDGVMPVVIVAGAGTVPATILLLERRMKPIIAGVLPPDHEPLTGIPHRPHIVGVDL